MASAPAAFVASDSGPQIGCKALTPIITEGSKTPYWVRWRSRATIIYKECLRPIA